MAAHSKAFLALVDDARNRVKEVDASEVPGDAPGGA